MDTTSINAVCTLVQVQIPGQSISIVQYSTVNTLYMKYTGTHIHKKINVHTFFVSIYEMTPPFSVMVFRQLVFSLYEVVGSNSTTTMQLENTFILYS